MSLTDLAEVRTLLIKDVTERTAGGMIESMMSMIAPVDVHNKRGHKRHWVGNQVGFPTAEFSTG
jgi:hypothetical protein